MVKRNILVIDNQITQFEILRDHLQRGEDYLIHENHEERLEVFPKAEDYVMVLDCVRTFLGPYYIQDNRQDIAFKHFFDYIKTIRPELIVVDYMLSGTYEGGNGIDLVKRLRLYENRTYENIAVIFLSRTLKSSQLVKDNLIENESTIWVEKGYAGLENLDPTYLHKHLKSNIPKMIGKSELSLQFHYLDLLLSTYEVKPNFRMKIEAFKLVYKNLGKSIEMNTAILKELVDEGLGSTDAQINLKIDSLNANS